MKRELQPQHFCVTSMQKQREKWYYMWSHKSKSYPGLSPSARQLSVHFWRPEWRHHQCSGPPHHWEKRYFSSKVTASPQDTRYVSTSAVILYLVILMCSLQSVSQMEPFMSIMNTYTCFRKCCCSWRTVAGIWKQTDCHEQRLVNQVCNTLCTHARTRVFSAPNSNRSPSCGHLW